MKPLVLLDLDGPLVDVRPRYLALHRQLVRAAGAEPLSAAHYWRLKRAREPETEIFVRCGVPAPRAAALAMWRRQHIEDPPMLELDVPWRWAAETLCELRRMAHLVLVTQRQPGAELNRQIDRFGFAPAIEDVLAGREHGGETDKSARVVASRWAGADRAVMVGDTEVDVVSGHALGIPVVWTRTGIRSERSIRPFCPDAAIDDIRQLAAWMRSQGWS